MAWNEPGNSNNQDPWGGKRKNEQGPPDLDEVIKKMQEGLSKLFGGKSGSGKGGGSAPSGKVSGGLIGIVLVALAVLWAAGGFYTVDQQERAVVLRLGKFLETVSPGLQWNPPLIDSVNKINVTQVRTHNSRGIMLTEDENIVEVSLSVQYVVSNPKDFYLNVRNPEISLVHATESALRHVVGSSEMHGVLTEGRELIANNVQKRLQSYLDRYGAGLGISKVNIENTQAPKEVQSAFDDVIKAREDEQRVKNEAEAYANQVVPEARGYAQRLREEANAYREEVIARAEGEAARFTKLLTEYEKAPEVTRERLYIDTLELVLSSTSKVMVDVKGGNNMLYLPLDKLTQASTSQLPAGTVGPRDLDELTNQVIEKIRERQSSGRLREGR